MFSLGTGFNPRKILSSYGIFDRLIIADLKMQEGQVFDTAPMTAVKTVIADEIDGSGNIAVRRA